MRMRGTDLSKHTVWLVCVSKNTAVDAGTRRDWPRHLRG
jgi:hypothetical protein